MKKPIDNSDPLHNTIKNLESLVTDTKTQVNDVMSELAQAEETQDIDTFLKAHQKPKDK